MSGQVAYILTLRCRNHEPPLRELTPDPRSPHASEASGCPTAGGADNYYPFVHTIHEKGSAMERNPQQQKQGAARCLSIFTFMIPDPFSPSTVHQPLFTDHLSLIPVKAHCSL
jgi:hypothetical protein